ncbi:hypothetical protein LTR84_000216 [Exophiala bonariae]|uniref:DUF7605 domain-containing protein n=1 Tax=Exophiala bonariae TaxID=1690606 RepID=A0AAV9NTY7_9EURO|nr:hypothetical protein LTR84_000216 [Exophiala bonariae]
MAEVPVKSEEDESLTMVNSEDPWNDPCFLSAQKVEVDILRQIEVAIERLPSNTKKGLWKKKLAKAQSHNHRTLRKRVALIGMSGHGKSSVLGETLGDSGVARTSGIGRAVTYTAQEYVQRRTGQTQKYTLVCSFLTRQERKSRMETLLEDWRRIEVEGISPSDREFTVMKDNEKTALATIRAALKNVRGFDLRKLEYGKNGITQEAAVEQLHQWVDEMPLPNGATEGGRYEQTFTDAKVLQKSIHDFQRTGLWPFIASSRIFLDSGVLKDGLILVDLPGCFDSNHIRATVADAYLPRAQEVWIVANISRAADSPVIENLAERYFRETEGVGDLHRPAVNIICTFAGDIPDDIDWEDEEFADEETSRAIRKAEEYCEMAEDQSPQGYEQAKYDRRILKMKARNSFVTREIEGTWSSVFASGKSPLKVFCVDNKLHREDSKREKTDSGIPELRKYASGIMSQILFKNAMDSLCVETPALIRSVETYIDVLKHPPAVSQAEIAIGSVEIEEAHIHWEQWEKTVSEACHHITQSAKAKRKTIIASASVHLDDWETLAWQTLGAFFRRGGAYRIPKTKVQVSWSAQLMGCILTVVKSLWRRLDRQAVSAWDLLISSIMDRFKIHESKYGSGEGPETMLRLLESRKNYLKSLLNAERAEFKKNMLEVKLKAVTSDTQSYMFSVMQPVFRESASDRGVGVKARSIQRLKTIIESGDFLTDYADTVDDACDDLISATKRGFDKVIAEVAGDINADLEPVIAAELSDSFSRQQHSIISELDEHMFNIALKESQMNANIEKAKAMAERVWGLEANLDLDAATSSDGE